jgi:hypothetical protein
MFEKSAFDGDDMRFKKYLNYSFLILVCVLLNTSCLSFFDKTTYLTLINGYENDVNVEIKYSNNENLRYDLAKSSAIIRHKRISNINSIKILNDDSSIIAEYKMEYLDEKRKGSSNNIECWLIFKNGITLVPDKYQYYSEWKKYYDIVIVGNKQKELD